MLLWKSLNLNRKKEERDQLYKEDIKRSPRCREGLTMTEDVIGRHLQGCSSPHRQPHLLAACSGAKSSQGKLKGLSVLGGSCLNSLRRVGRHCGLHGRQWLPFRMSLRGAFDATLAWSWKAEAFFNQFRLQGVSEWVCQGIVLKSEDAGSVDTLTGSLFTHYRGLIGCKLFYFPRFWSNYTAPYMW